MSYKYSIWMEGMNKEQNEETQLSGGQRQNKQRQEQNK